MSSVALFIQLVFLYCPLSCCLVFFFGFRFFSLVFASFHFLKKKEEEKKEKKKVPFFSKRKRGGMSYPTDWLIAISIS